ncbi:hypothetical protein AFLA_001545 [Aspergillus flavus NRRL3357]|nr:hypothetical protein AFLA_001545 [Aspergillus flavus NRRL3357]
MPNPYPHLLVPPGTLFRPPWWYSDLLSTRRVSYRPSVLRQFRVVFLLGFRSNRSHAGYIESLRGWRRIRNAERPCISPVD